MVAIRTQRGVEAQQCYKFTLRLGLDDANLRRQIEVGAPPYPFLA